MDLAVANGEGEREKNHQTAEGQGRTYEIQFSSLSCCFDSVYIHKITMFVGGNHGIQFWAY